MPSEIDKRIRLLAREYSERLNTRINARMTEMANDDNSHYLIYQVLGISLVEGRLIDEYQSRGRFLYNYAGRFLEAATKICFSERFPDSGSLRIPNSQGLRPKTYEIDCVVGSDAIEIKWRDATTDGDHTTKEHSRLQSVCDAGYTPVRIMFYYPNRSQAIRIQQTLETLYKGVGGKYHHGEAAWAYVEERTRIDLLSILEEVAQENG